MSAAGLICGLAAVAFLFLFGSVNSPIEPPKHESANPSTPQTADVMNLQLVPPHGETPPILAIADVAPNPLFNKRNFKREYSEATNYWSLVQSLLPATAVGEADAQYYLYKALAYCVHFYDPTSKSAGAPLEPANVKGLAPTLAQTAFDRCHDLQEQVNASPVEISAEDWLESAAANGQELAKMEIAAKMLTQARIKENAARDDAGSEKIYNAPNPISVIRSALATGEPDAIFEMALLPLSTTQSADDRNIDSLAWRFIACQRGYDCSDSADWVVQACQSNPECALGATGTDVLRAAAGDQIDRVKKRASEFDSLLATNNWEQLVPDLNFK